MTAPRFEDNKIIGSLTAGSAITFARFLTIAASDDVNQTAADGRVDGVAYLAAADEAPVSIAVDGIVVLEASGDITDGDSLVSAANGRAKVSTDLNCYAIALEDATVGAHFSALLMPKNTDFGGHGLETIINAPGAISVSKTVTIVEPTGTDAMTLADGVYDGQLKFIKQGATGAAGVTVITGDFELNGTTGNTLTFDNAGEYAWMVWDEPGTTWQIMVTTGALTTV